MKTLRELYRIGRGPSSSHTIGVQKACELFLSRFSGADAYGAVLRGSLACTGRGHGTDGIIRDTLGNSVRIEFDTAKEQLAHPNTLDLTAYKDGGEIGANRFYSVGGGAIRIEGEAWAESPDIYRHRNFEQVKSYCMKKDLRLCGYVTETEGTEITEYLCAVWRQMKATVAEGLNREGILPGPLKVQRKARYLYRQKHIDESAETRENRMVCAYAFAAAEQNADGGVVVTAPTCGASGVIPAVLYYMQIKHGFADAEIVKALATGGLIGNLIKANASISGAECGCQAEIGAACSMAAAALTELFEMRIEQTEYAAEVALEHHLGLTCDPIGGYVQIPCIERNAVAAMRAINAWNLSDFLTDTRKISFDLVVETMYRTGKDLPGRYRETGRGGLAKLYKDYAKGKKK